MAMATPHHRCYKITQLPYFSLYSHRESNHQMSDTTTFHKFDVFLSFRGLDTRRNLISFLYNELIRRNIRTFKDDKELERGRRISPELVRAIQESRFAVVVVSVNYAASPWCLEELVKIMDFENKGSITVMPVFYGVDPCHVRRQIGLVEEQFKKHEDREDHEKVLSWRQALTNLASISGDCSWKWEDDSKMVDEITDKISKRLMIDTTRSNGSDLVGIDAHMKALHRLLDLNSKKTVRVIGIWARGGNGRSALAKFVYQNICQHFESHCFLESVKRISQDRQMSHLHEEFMIRIQGECLSKLRLKNQKVLLVADDVNKLEQLDALAEDFNCFGPGSIVIITTQDKQLLISSGIKLVYEVELLRFQKVRGLFRQLAFKERDVSAAFELALYRAANVAMEWLGCLRGRSG
ncbi:PREDICTED: TMV resistance protein N-like isoform X1 [Camelina sativa]|uniref:TMV resistance protein N-like isoform X1 n=1 Tax=Camelina sativa TaxID=90675 RepID=A0ABM1Q986_CAMSA|nr:PREDICTED: TMV resistance protein N-like isoform X1 [Camelina sativa]